MEFLPGQFDQRADSAVQCVQFLKEDEQPIIKTAVTYLLIGTISDSEFDKIKSYCINPVDSRETGLEKPETLVQSFEEPADVGSFDGFADMDEDALSELYGSLGLAMTFKDSSTFRIILRMRSTETRRSRKSECLTPIGPTIAAIRRFLRS